jgi:holo-[acyl-carrier protein] synthase
MNIISHGIDIIEINHIKQIVERSGDRFEIRCFTAGERDSLAVNSNRIQYLSGCFAAKESVLKALGKGWSQGTSFLDIEIKRLSTGQPSIELHAKCREIAGELGIAKWILSISHTSTIAMASVIAVGSNSID